MALIKLQILSLGLTAAFVSLVLWSLRFVTGMQLLFATGRLSILEAIVRLVQISRVILHGLTTADSW
ncbi:MAG: hypothetical protein AAGH76_03370 [Pseudomonadota bacterium]